MLILFGWIYCSYCHLKWVSFLKLIIYLAVLGLCCAWAFSNFAVLALERADLSR